MSKRLLYGGFAVLCLGGLGLACRAWVAPLRLRSAYEGEFPIATTVFWDHADMFRMERGHFPGLGSRGDGVSTEDHTCDFIRAGVVTNGGTTRLRPDGGLVQTFVALPATDRGFAPALCNTVTERGPVPRTLVLLGHHCLVDLEEDPSMLDGRYVRPLHFQYVSGCGDVGGVGYWLAYGCFGDGDGLPAGTGRACLRISNLSLKRRAVLTWERYSPQGGGTGQLHFACADEYTGSPDAPERCYIPSTAELMTDDAAVFEKALTKLKSAGWQL